MVCFSVSIELEENSQLWAPAGTYSTVDFKLRLSENTTQVKSVLISHLERFPSHSHHATFVTNLRPQAAKIGFEPPVKLRLTIFAPNYVPNGSRVLISLIIREKPNILVQNALKIGQKSFYFSFTNVPLYSIDPNPPNCIRQIANHTFNEICQNLEECNAKIWSGHFIVNDEISGLKEVKAQEAEVGNEAILIGKTSNSTLEISSNCCHQGIWFEVTDVAGNSKLCDAHTNTGEKEKCPILLIAILAYVTLRK